MEEFVLFLKEKGWSVGTIESCTGGLFASMLCDISGVSSVYKGSIVTYSSELKERLVHVSSEAIEKYGVVSTQVAHEMAVSGKDVLGVDVCISFTGNAGPGICDDKPVGRVYVSVAYLENCLDFEFQLEGSRNEIRSCVIEEILKKLKNFWGF